jgi:hypothetical protein
MMLRAFCELSFLGEKQMCRFVGKRRIVFYILLVSLLTTSCIPKLDEQFKAYQDAHNSGNVRGVLSLCAEDIKYEVVDQRKVEGKDKFRSLVEMDAVLNSRLIFTDVKVSGKKVTCVVEERNDWLELAGIDALNYEYREFTFEKGLIKTVRTKHTDESARAMQEFGVSFGKWAAEKRQEELVALRREGPVNKGNVDKWLSLMREWREDTKKEEE